MTTATATRRAVKQAPATCACGRTLGGDVRAFVHVDDANAAINKSARAQCVTCYAVCYLSPALDARLDAAMSADTDARARSDYGKSPRDRLVVAPVDDGWTVYL